MRWLDDIGLFLIYLISFWFRYFDRMNFLRFQHNKVPLTHHTTTGAPSQRLTSLHFDSLFFVYFLIFFLLQ